jgi:hypothetical protein
MRVLKVLLASLPLMLCASETIAQTAVPCGDRAKLIAMLDSKYSETLANVGVTGQSQLVEVYVSDKGTFTVVMTNNKGVACVIAAGDSWEKLSPMKKFTAS